MSDKKILVVDDSLTQRKIQTRMLQKAGYSHIAEAKNGKVALEMLGQANFDLLILDWNMPEMDGMAVLDELAGHGKYPELKIIMVSSNSEEAAQQEALKKKANAYLTKPFTEDALLKKVASLLQQ